MASMEPCLFRHGKGDHRVSPGQGVHQLQWSHVFSDMVREAVGERAVALVLLQWSHVFSDMVRMI